MGQLNVKLGDGELSRLREYARRRRTPVTWLIKDYVDYLLHGGHPVRVDDGDVPSSSELAAFAARGGAFEWLADEPDLYSGEDGEPL